jgi:hypothetical protein
MGGGLVHTVVSVKAIFGLVDTSQFSPQICDIEKGGINRFPLYS